MIYLAANKCDFCGTCLGVCPENCIELKTMDLSIDHNICTLCMRCVRVCPVLALYREKA